MKTLNFKLDNFQLAMVSSSFRKKTDIIRFWMNAIKIMSAYANPNESNVVAELQVHVDKMSRLFLSSTGKCVSVNFPFITLVNDEGLVFKSSACGVVDSMMSSNILSLLARDTLSAEEVLEFAEPILDVSVSSQRTWALLRDLILEDDGYLRFDHDPERQDGHRHPLNHIDIFYSQSSTFKLGVASKLSLSELSDILDARSECQYLARA